MLKGQGIPKKGVREFFSHVMGENMIFNGNMILIGIQSRRLIIHGIDAVTEYIQFRKVFLQILRVVKSLIMQGQSALPD